MGMGFSAAVCWVIDDDKLRKVSNHVSSYRSKLDTVMEKYGIDLALVAKCVDYQDWYDVSEVLYDDHEMDETEVEEVLKEIETLLGNICAHFNSQTGLYLDLAFHDSMEYGDRYDDVDGAFWALTGVTELTPAGKKATEQGLVWQAHFVHFG